MKDILKKIDKPLFLFMILYTILGLVMIFSASSITAVLYNKVEESYFFKKQLIFVVASWIMGMGFILRFPTSKYKKIAPLAMLGITASLALLIPYGSITNSARSWYNLGFFSFQPSEFVKSIMIVFLGIYFEKIIVSKRFEIKYIVIPFIIVLLACGLIAYQPDLGTAIIVAGIAGMIFLSLPIKTKEMKYMKIGGIITAIILFLFVIVGGGTLNKEQSSRLTYKSPCTRYTEKTGYQVCNGFIAISNGGLFGVGLGNSTQKYLYLPEAHTDFIFPIICEELGTIVGVLIIIGFIFILWRLLVIARNANSIKGSIIAYGTFCYILLHLLINFMGILALIPLTGVPVPFLSYGGSFYINLIGLLFLNQRIVYEKNNNKTKELLRSI